MNKSIYIAPEVEIVEVKVEQGFAQSGVPGSASTEDLFFEEGEYTWS